MPTLPEQRITGAPVTTLYSRWAFALSQRTCLATAAFDSRRCRIFCRSTAGPTCQQRGESHNEAERRITLLHRDTIGRLTTKDAGRARARRREADTFKRTRQTTLAAPRVLIRQSAGRRRCCAGIVNITSDEICDRLMRWGLPLSYEKSYPGL
jgi:hypothetical protein